MAHPLGPRAHNLAASAIYATAQAEMRRAYALIDAGRYLDAAAELDSAAHAAEVLVTAGKATPPLVQQPRLRELLPSREEWRQSAGPENRGAAVRACNATATAPSPSAIRPASR